MNTTESKRAVACIRFVRSYRIVSHTATKVKIAWQEKIAPDIPYHRTGKGRRQGWRRRQATVPHDELKRLYAKNPPNAALCESAGRKKTHESERDIAAPSDSQQQLAMHEPTKAHKP